MAQTGGGSGGASSSQGFDAGTDPERNAVQAGTICERLSTIQCAGEAACCSHPGRDFAACKQDMLQQCNSAELDTIAAAPSAAFDPAQARMVFDRLEQFASRCDPEFVHYSDSVAGLRTIFRGTLPAGGECTPTDPTDKALAAPALAACAQVDSYACLPALLGAWTCAAHAGVGGGCFSDANCMADMTCNNPNLLPSGGTCLMRHPEGTSCMHSVECLSVLCRGMPKTCVAATAETVYCLKH